MRSDQIKKGTEKAPHRALLKSLGLEDDDITKPLIGIANSYTNIVPGHIHLRTIGEAVKEGILAAGGTPFEFSTIAVCDGIAMGHEGMRYSLPSREIIADSVEIMLQAHSLDGLVMISNCDKITPGMLMAAARVDIPAIMVTGGPMAAGRLHGKKISYSTMPEALGQVAAGKMTEGELCELEENACPGCGSCSGMFTANTMACLTEALGDVFTVLRNLTCEQRLQTAVSQSHRQTNPQTNQRQPQTLANSHQGSLRKRHRSRHGSWRLHKHHATPAGNR